MACEPDPLGPPNDRKAVGDTPPMESPSARRSTEVALRVPLQVEDSGFRPVVENPAFPEGQGPVVLIDEAHANFHTAAGRVFGQRSKDDAHRSIHGWLQAAAVRVGTGRVAAFGEAAMFSAQLAGPARMPMGMNHPLAKQNAQFTLNVLHWLSGLLEDRKRHVPLRR